MRIKIPFLSSKQQSFALKKVNESYLSDTDVRLTDLLAPAIIEEQPGYLNLGGAFTRTLRIVSYPREVENGWLDRLHLFPAAMLTSCYIYPLPSGPVVTELTEQASTLEGALLADAKRGKIPDPYTQTAYADAMSLRQAIADNQVRMYAFQFMVTLLAPSLDELDRLTRELKQDLAAGVIGIRPAYFEQGPAFKASLPLFLFLAGRQRNIDSLSLSTSFPYVTAKVFHPKGEVWGLSLADGSPVAVDRGIFQAGHMIIIAETGSGKSYAFKIILTQSRFKGRKIYLIDPSPPIDYKRWTLQMDGAFVVLGAGSTIKINPLEITLPADLSNLEEADKRPVSAKTAFLISWLELLLCTPEEKFSSKERAVLFRAVQKTYAEKGIGDSFDEIIAPPSLDKGFSLNQREVKEMPVLEDLYNILQTDPEGRDLAQRMEPYVHGALDVFNGQTNVDLDKDVVVFNIHQLISMQEALAPAAYGLLSEFIVQRLRMDLEAKEIGVDEAHHMFKREQTAYFAERLFREARKNYGRVTLISHNLSDFLGEEGMVRGPAQQSARVCLRNAPVKFIMHQDDVGEVDYIGREFGLSEALAFDNA